MAFTEQPSKRVVKTAAEQLDAVVADIAVA
jgi:hypothetical protein